MISLLDLTIFLSAIAVASASPLEGRTVNVAGIQNIRWPRGRPLPVDTTRLSSGATIGWIRREDQLDGSPIASPPPPTNFKTSDIKPELVSAGLRLGPKGTVPFQLLSEEEISKIPPKRSPVGQNGKLAKRATDGHYYGYSSQALTNYGGSCIFSCFKSYVADASSMSLVQIAASNNKQIQQTVEAGWQTLPNLNNGDYKPHLFTFFTTNAYASRGDYVGGYNALQKGWVQVDASYYPGMTFSPYSVIDGKQYFVPLAYQLFNGNWWVSANNVWMGYYLGSMFAINGQLTNTLGENADYLSYYGETYENPLVLPKTDMGSGRYAKQGYGKAAYMRNLTVYNTPTTFQKYKGKFWVSNSSWYTVDPHMNSGTNWGSYFYVGGPGGR